MVRSVPICTEAAAPESSPMRTSIFGKPLRRNAGLRPLYTSRRKVSAQRESESELIEREVDALNDFWANLVAKLT